MNNFENFKDLEKYIYNLVCDLGCLILKEVLENYDKNIMENRNKKEYRHKGYKDNTIKTVMGEVEYKRAIYLKEGKYIYLLDNQMSINTIGKLSSNLVDIMLKTIVNTVSYRKAEDEIKNITNETISHQALQQLVWKVGSIIESKENEEINLFKKDKLKKGEKQVVALFEEADGLWINLQGNDRKEQIERYMNKCERNNKIYKPLRSVKTELKLHITYEGWKKGSERHELINKRILAGMMNSKTLENLRNARIYQIYDLDNLKLRVCNGDGAKWISNIATKDTICQKDSFHIQQEIIRDIKDKKYREELINIINDKKYSEVQDYIESLKVKVNGEEKYISKLNKLKKYLKNGLPRYQDILDKQGRKLPVAPEGLEFRDMGTMESQIFSILKVRLCSGRKSFLKKGANYLSKICAKYYELHDNISLESLIENIYIDNSVEEWINSIEENVKKYKNVHKLYNKEVYNSFSKGFIYEKNPQIKELLRFLEPTSLFYR